MVSLPLILFLPAHFLVIGKLPGHLTRDGVLPTDSHSVLQLELGVSVSQSQQPGARCRHQRKPCQRRAHFQSVHPPEQPCNNIADILRREFVYRLADFHQLENDINFMYEKLHTVTGYLSK